MPLPKKGRRKTHLADDDYFSEVNERWNLEGLYADLATVGSVLTPIQKKYLRGVLLGHSLTNIDKELQLSPGRTRVVLSKSVYPAIRALTGEKTVNSGNLPTILYQWGYAKKVKNIKPPSDENPYLPTAITALLNNEKLTLHVNGKQREDFSEKIKALTEAMNELTRQERFTVSLHIEITSNPASLDDQEVSLLSKLWNELTNSLVQIAEPITEIDEIESLSQTIVEREVTWFFQELFNIAKSDLENRFLSPFSRDLIASSSFEHKDSVIQAFFSSARVVMYVNCWDRMELAARAEIERTLTPLLHKTSKVIFVVRPVFSFFDIVWPYHHVVLPLGFDPDFSRETVTIKSFCPEFPELVAKFYGEDDFETAIHKE